MADDKFDVIVIGAGVAGSTAALLLARAGLEVVLVERGPYPGSKNLSGGVLYAHSLHQVLPNFWETAPVERRITNQVVSFLTADSHVNLDYKSQAVPDFGGGAFTVLRAKFDRWLAAQAEEAGAVLVTSIKVDRVLKDGSRVTGVAAGGEEILADVVIAADGANSFIAQEAGLRGRLPTDEIALGVKELIGLPAEIIQERFQLREDEGAAYSIVGYATRGVAGGGFLYTNRDSLSIGLVMQTADLVQNRARPADILEDFLAHPMIAPLIKDGKVLEYGAHLVPECGISLMPDLFDDCILLVGDAAGLGVNNGFVVRGMDLAISSAICAAETVIAAKEALDFSAGTLKDYKTRLEASSVMADMHTYHRAPRFFQNQKLYSTYPEMIANLMHKIYTHNGQPKKHILEYALQSARECNLSMPELAGFILAGARAL
jgi:electron transfer flavoprotein-quinone oxidoreductase